MLAHIKQFLLDVNYQRVYFTEFILNIIRKLALNNFVATKVFILNSSYLVLLENLFQKILTFNAQQFLLNAISKFGPIIFDTLLLENSL